MREANPMLGLRGIRLGLVMPQIIQMQVRAILEAACNVEAEGVKVLPEIMIPLTGHVNELKRTRELLEDPDILSTDIVAESAGIVGEGVGCVEAPRGTLFHHYWTNEMGQLTRVNLIVATGHNNWAMSKSVDMVAKRYIDGKHLTEGMLNRVEAAIRAHDPCLSCSTHAVGQMPMVVEVYDAGECWSIE